MNRRVTSFLLALSAVMTVVIATGCSTASVPSGENGPFQQPASGLVQSSTGGAVTIDVKWLSLDDAALTFSVSMDTHSVELDGYDLGALAILRDDSGNEYSPLSWNSSPGGHHRRGTLTFAVSASLAEARYVEMVIRDVAGVKERVLKWQL